jgi:protein SCO1/2
MMKNSKLMAVLALGVVVLAGLFFWMTSQTPQQNAGASLGGPFELVDHHGQPFTHEDLKGKYTLLYFGYTYCPDVCPTELQTIAEALGMLGDMARDFRVVMVSVDPERDTPEVLKEYMSNFGDNFLGLTGTPEQIRKMARNWRTFYRKAEEKGPDDYLMDHSAIVFLLDKQGKYMRHFAYGTSPERIAEGIREAIARKGGSS